MLRMGQVHLLISGFLCIFYVCYLLSHIACSKDSQVKIPVHRLMTDGDRMNHQLEIQKVRNPKQYQQEFLMASSDPDVIKIHPQSSLCRI